ncbi:MAG TPA: HAD family hydrolase [Eoetvoesiella sp.]|jgi:HAD superfamily hydrolase (TIGR01490 family)|uniref:HAD family hydrolase n=1 Tax=Eoetvoesiella sp. TaxID=1966355 RepID=UPI002C0DB12A|nr:HAD family hydrolase [Eoetvoesiella sp.]HWK60695.1 HAD family hydrolase [Eoetvoesiella sp.]
MTAATRLALFDLDHTLLPMDSDYQWADWLARTGRAGDPQEAQRRNNELMERYNAGNLTAEQAAEFMLGLLARADSATLAEWHEQFMHEVVRPNILPVAQELVQRHLEQGDLCAVVTATNEFVTAPIARAFGIPHLIATVPEYRNGRYTGAIQGIPSFKEGKVVRVQNWLSSLNLALDDFEQSRFYSDSPNDIPLMEAVTHPVATNPSPSLRRFAQEKGWPILEIFKDMQDAKS